MKDVGIQNARVCRCVPVSDPAARAQEDHSLPREGHRQWGGEGLKGRQLEYVRRTVCGACASASVYQRFAFAFVSIHGSDSATALTRSHQRHTLYAGPLVHSAACNSSVYGLVPSLEHINQSQ